MAQQLPPAVLQSRGAEWFLKGRAEAQANAQSRPMRFSPYRMEIEGAGTQKQWGWVSFSARYTDLRVNNGAKAEDSLFTPKYLARALQKFPAGVKKMSSCRPAIRVDSAAARAAPAPEETLVTLENVTVLTASRADRTSSAAIRPTTRRTTAARCSRCWMRQAGYSRAGLAAGIQRGFRKGAAAGGGEEDPRQPALAAAVLLERAEVARAARPG